MAIVRSIPDFLKSNLCNEDDEPLSPCFFMDKAWLKHYFDEWSSTATFGYWMTSKGAGKAYVVLSQGTRISRLGIPYRSLGFNEATEPLLENITLEFNGFLYSKLFPSSKPTDEELEETFWSFLDDLLEIKEWDEIRVNALDAGFAEKVFKQAKERQLITTLVGERKTYWVDLDQVRRENGGDFLSSLSANTRSQLKRARKTTEAALGPLTLTQPADLNEAYEWFNALGELHQARWNPKKTVIGFSNPRFVKFHNETISRLWPLGQLQLFRLAAGDITLAYLYNFLIDGHAYFIMSGIGYDQPKASKPGMLAHWLAIEHNLALGVKIYDFLAGTHQYKQSLSTHSANQSNFTLRRARRHFRVENWLRNFKRRNLKQTHKAPTGLE
jgi:hypothetical protein